MQIKKTLKRFVTAAGDFGEFYELAIKFVRQAKITISQLKKEMECSDLETFYTYNKRLEKLEGR